MAEDRPIYKSDLDELRVWMKERFDKQDEVISKIEAKVDDERDTNIRQEVRLKVVEDKLGSYAKWIGGVVASVFLMILAMILEHFGRGP